METQAKKIEVAGGKFSSMNRLNLISEFEKMEKVRNKPQMVKLDRDLEKQLQNLGPDLENIKTIIQSF